MAVKPTELVAWIRAELENAKGYDTSELAALRTEAMDRYFGKPRGDEQKGRSDAQSNDVADMVEAIVAQVLPAFSQDSIAEFEPMGDDDADSAAAESLAVNATIVEENRGYTMLQEAVRDALLLRNGWTKVELDDRERVTQPKYDGVTSEEAAQILAQANERGEVEILSQEPGEEDGTWDMEFKVTEQRRRIVVRAVDPINMAWAKDHEFCTLEGIRFLAERWRPTRSQLIAEGYSKRKVNAVLGYYGDQEPQQLARDEERNLSSETRDKATQRIRCRWIHYRYDGDGDGIAELHRILFLEDAKGTADAILENEVVDFVPYATGTPILQPHRLDGLGVYDKLREIEKNKTWVMRQWLDNQKTANQPGLLVNSNVADPQSFVVRRPGMVVGVEAEPMAAVMPIPVTDVGASCVQALDYLDKVRSERSGAALDLMARQELVAGDTAHGIERQISAKELMAAMMTRTLAETLVRDTWLLTHAGLRLWFNKPMSLRVAGEMTEVNPITWPERDRVNVRTGLSVAERSHRRDVLAGILAKQEQLWTGGEADVMVSRENYHNALIDYTRAAQIDNGERYFTDPSSDDAQKAIQQKAERAEQQEAVQVRIAEIAASAEQDAQRIENALEAWKTNQDNAVKLFIEAFKGELDLIKQGMGSEDDADTLQDGMVAGAVQRAASGQG